MPGDATAKDIDYLLVSALWPALQREEFNASRKYYAQLLEYLQQQVATVQENPEFFAFHSTESIIHAIGLVRHLNSITLLEKEPLVEAVSVHLDYPGASAHEKILRSVGLAVSVWLTATVSCLDFPRPGLLTWREHETLHDLISLSFPSQQKAEDQGLLDNAPLDFTAASLVASHGFTLAWTSNLAMHLTVDWDDRVMTIYEHKIALHNNLRFSHAALPLSLLTETLDTLNLLFPFQDPSTKRLLTRHAKTFYGLGRCVPRPPEDDAYTLQHFSVWRTRVAELARVSQEPPVGLRQLRLTKGGENMLPFATFWIACGAGLLAVVSIAFAIAATVYSALQYELSRAQYRLDLAQACLDPAAREALARFCDGSEYL